MSNSLNKIEIGKIDSEFEIIKPTVLGKFIFMQKLLLIELNSKGVYANSIKMDIQKQVLEIEQIIAIINYMDESKLTRKFNIK